MLSHFRPSLLTLIHIGLSRIYHRYLSEPDLPAPEYVNPYKFFSWLNETDPGLFHEDGSPKRARYSRFPETDTEFHKLKESDTLKIVEDEAWLKDQLEELDLP